MITAVVFDFDGLILDTETPIFRSWAEAYDECGVAPLTIDEWAAAIGTVGGFDPLAELEGRLALARAAQGAGRAPAAAVVLEEVLSRRKVRRDALLAGETVRPGVADWVAAAHRLGMGVGVASSSGRDWVRGHLRRLELLEDFDTVLCFGDDASPVPAGGGGGRADEDQKVVAPHDGGLAAGAQWPAGRMRAKPAPDLYLAVCRALGADPGSAVAVEDSPHGIRAARAAGMSCIAVPNPLTRLLELAGANLVVDSLAEITLTEAIEALAG